MPSNAMLTHPIVLDSLNNALGVSLALIVIGSLHAHSSDSAGSVGLEHGSLTASATSDNFSHCSELVLDVLIYIDIIFVIPG